MALCLLALCCSLIGGCRRGSHCEGGRDVGRGIKEGGAGVADVDAEELDASPISSKGAKEEVVLLGLLGELVVAAEVHAKANLEENEGAVLRSKESWSGVGSAGTPRA